MKNIYNFMNEKYWNGINIYTHRTNCNGSCDYICRCTQITGFEIEHINLNLIRQQICDYIGIKKTINQYVVDRLITYHRLYERDTWNIDIIEGYYGQEYNGPYPKSEILHELLHNIDKTLNLISDREKINQLLLLEYKYLLDSLKDKKYVLASVPKNEIFKQQDHYIKSNVVNSYVEYDLPRGIVVLENNKYRLIDGYHRIKASKENAVKVWMAK